jgi:hypothetical protein
MVSEDGVADEEFESFEIGEARCARGITVGLLPHARNSNDRHAISPSTANPAA